ncbi:MAG: SPOR domain-containing protein, partial [Rhizobiales bacterium]|nr:SPOR domain-containing protein [Hyphomicrobiales bacterium]
GLRLPPGRADESVLRAAPDAVDPASQTSLFAPSPRPKPRPTTRVAVNNPQAGAAPAATRPTIPAPARNAAASSALQGFAVQVASHRRQSEAVAAFADLQRRYPSLITGYQPLIQRADLGDRGIYYRLRIGPVATKSDANSLCTSLKSAGLPGCLVRPL